MSDVAHTATTDRTWVRATPVRSTITFCGPIATISPAPVSRPASAVENQVMATTLGTRS